MAERDLVVRLIGDDRDLNRAFTNTERRTRQFESRMTATNQTLRGALSGFGGRSALLFGSGAFISTAAITAGIAKSVEAASDLNEEIAKSQQVFGDSARDIRDWSTTTASSMGIARVEALRATGTFGNLFRVVDIAPEQAAEMSRALVQLTADLASFNNASPEDVLTALRAGLIGEAEPLRRYGVLLSEARVQQIALARSGKDNVKELTNQEKALARYEIILQDTAVAQGDFARTSDSLANQSRILRANLSDLASNLGGVFLPAVKETVSAINALFDGFRALDRLGGKKITLDVGVDVDVTQLIRARNELQALTGEGDVLIQTLDEAIAKITEARTEGRPPAAGPGLGIGRDLARQAAREASEVERQALETDRERRRARKAFDELAKGLGLKLDRASLTAALDDDLAALRELERAILRQIDREGRTFELVERLTQVRIEISGVTAQRAEAATQDARDAWQRTLDALDLRLERAVDTATLEDDLRALRAIELAITRRISSEGRTLELERQLLEVRRQQADVRRQQAEQLREQREAEREARQGRQFRALGLTEEGEERVPGVAALRRRAGRLEDQIRGTVLDTQRTRTQLQRIAQVLAGQFGEVGREVRQAILEMLNDITRALEGDGRGKTLQTAFQKTGIDQLIEGLGLSAEEIKELRQRFARVGPEGTVPGRGPSAFGIPVTETTGAGNIIVNGDIVVQDPRDVDAFVREVQRRAQRSAPSRRGVRAGTNRGLG